MEAFFEACGSWLKNRKNDRADGCCDEETARLPGAIYEQLLGYTPCVAQHDLVIKERRSGRYRFHEAVPMSTKKSAASVRGNKTNRFIPKGAFFLMRKKNASARKGSGTYYTPQYIVRHMVENAVDAQQRRLNGGEANGALAGSADEILSVSVLDPAMGSGAFLITAATFLADRLHGVSSVAKGNRRSPVSRQSMATCRQEVIRHCIYGVDVDPPAVEMARMSLRLLAWDEHSTLLDADMNLKTGDALFGMIELPSGFEGGLDEADRIARGRYIRTVDDPARYPEFFHWPLEFPKQFSNKASAHPGFSVVLSNPPYGDLLTSKSKDALKRFGYPPIGGRAEVAGHFLHQGLRLLEPGGTLSYIVPNTMIDGHQFGMLRENLTARARVASIIDFAKECVFSDAEVYAMIVNLVADHDPDLARSDDAYDAKYGCPAPEEIEAEPERIRIHPNSRLPWRKVLPFVDALSKAGCIETLSSKIAMCRDAGLDYKHKAVGWSRRGMRPRLKDLLTYEGERKHPNDFPLIRGRDIEPFRIAETRNFLIHDWRKYRDADTTVLVYEDLADVPVKIVTRQTSDRLVAALDRTGRNTAKSVHTVIVTNPDYSPEFICALLNSSAMNGIYQAYTGERGRTFAQVKVSDLRLLPVRKTGPDVQARVTGLVRRLEEPGLESAERDSLITELDTIFNELYGKA